MKGQKILVAGLCLLLCLTGCNGQKGPDSVSSTSAIRQQEELKTNSVPELEMMKKPFNENTSIDTVKNDPVFDDYGRLLFPADDGYMSGDTLGDLQLTWYNYIDPAETVKIVNTLWQRANDGETVFYDIYSDAEKAVDPDKEDTGLFFFKGEPGEKFAICNAGGGFSYVGAMQDSFPHALKLSKRGYNAFALIYRPGAQTACEDLARGAVRQELGWQHGLALTAQRHLAVTIFPSREQSSCSTLATVITQKTIRPLLPV